MASIVRPSKLPALFTSRSVSQLGVFVKAAGTLSYSDIASGVSMTSSSVAPRRWNMDSMSDLDKDELIIDIENDKAEKRIRIEELEEQQSVKQAQIDYAMNFMNDVYKLWIDADVVMGQRFQKVIFPEGVILDTASLSFGTLKISPLYRYAPNKKDLSVKEKSLVVTLPGIEPGLPG